MMIPVSVKINIDSKELRRVWRLVDKKLNYRGGEDGALKHKRKSNVYMCPSCLSRLEPTSKSGLDSVKTYFKCSGCDLVFNPLKYYAQPIFVEPETEGDWRYS